MPLTGEGTWFEDFWPGQRIRHARGATVGETEGQILTKLVLNTAQSHFNEHAMRGSPLGDGQLVFGLITASLVIGLTTEDTGENAVAEVGLDNLRFVAPVHHGDTLYAFTEVLATADGSRPDAGLVRFRHWGTNERGEIVFEGERTVLIKRRATPSSGRGAPAPDVDGVGRS
ncbi:MAG TPA: MaoC family dehydratase [Candidatus Dormibacteraeota bacterium]|nr:MaoC family dehydratase [Candidatus Dormibacteraeota bacterium]